MRAALPSKYSVSLAAPASFWYLRGFPLDKMHQYLDYIIYMTYDLHGQWDYGHKWASPGCPAGNCLRSHVNQTEVNDALVMITKAGVPAKKVIVGMPMYGRSFKMTKAGCWGPDCTYVGADSGAAPGRCTDTKGYISNFEIREIMKNGGVEQHHSDDGDILIYNGLEWVFWMNTDSYQKRLNWVKGLNFGGTSDWAIDLDANCGANDGAGKGDNGSTGKGESGSAGNVIISPDIYSQKGDAQVSCQPPCNFVFPPWILDQPTTISPPKATVTYFENWRTTITVQGAAITTTASSVTTTVISIPPITTKTISVWNHSWNGTNATIWLTASVPIPPLTLTRTSTSSSDFVRPVITWTYSPGPYPPLQTTNPGKPDPTPPGPPPPPPPGFAPTVKVTAAAPGPTCKPGQPCGKPCLLNCNPRDTGCFGICGCIGALCPGKSCIGSGCLAAAGEPSDCDSVTTVSDCLVECSVIQRPTTTFTLCDDPECTRTAAGCDTTGTTTTTTRTRMCAAAPAITDFSTVAAIGEGGAGGWVVEPGDFGSMTDDGPTSGHTGVQTCPPPQATVPSPPTITNLGDDKKCVKCDAEQLNEKMFKRADAEKAFSSVCDGTRTFGAAGGIATIIPVSKDLSLNIDVNRVQSSGCKDVKPFVLGDYCTKALEAVFTCDDNDKGSYGAVFVHNGDYGCVLWGVYAT
ncbi:uncharacterized protein TrAFT101_011669 [Trichoderma asperellum]|uniref:uncharacterized protein n=1 Tax=Trichoderma asperellum TaxID=101201 RepID=UPI003331B441|nr:hypothetical protein TrAFT101_011669 [Trichoderma asperellum]